MTGHGDHYRVDKDDPNSPYEYCFGLHEGSVGHDWGPTWNIDYYSDEPFQLYDPNSWSISQALDYKLGVFIGHSCYSANNSSSLIYSSNAIYCTFPDETYSYDRQAFTSAWGYVENEDGTYNIGGKQGTNLVENVTLYGDIW